MAGDERVICASSALQDGGDGVRFTIPSGGGRSEAFAIRFRGSVHAYLNRCGHVPMELDWNSGKFFDAEETQLICSTHGAIYDAASGACRGGPCRGNGLIRVPIIERDGLILIKENNDG
ncbi:MAG: Rieske (2Fe-2S) protein [Burkholderiales bacterium]